MYEYHKVNETTKIKMLPAPLLRYYSEICVMTNISGEES